MINVSTFCLAVFCIVTQFSESLAENQMPTEHTDGTLQIILNSDAEHNVDANRKDLTKRALTRAAKGLAATETILKVQRSIGQQK